MIVLSYTLVTASVYFIILYSWDRYRLVSLDYSSYLKSQSFKKQYCLILITVSVALIPGILETALLNTLTPLSDDDVFNCIIPSAYYPYLAFTLTASYSIIPVIFVTTFIVLFFKHLRRRMKRWTHVHNSSNGCSIIMLPPLNNGNVNQVGVNKIIDVSSIEPQSTDAGPGPSNRDHEEKTRATYGNKKAFENRYVKPAITYTALVLTLIICTSPLGLYTASTRLWCPECFDEGIFLYLVFLVYSKACLNPVIYILTHQKIRRFYQKMWNSIL